MWNMDLTLMDDNPTCDGATQPTAPDMDDLPIPPFWTDSFLEKADAHANEMYARMAGEKAGEPTATQATTVASDEWPLPDDWTASFLEDAAESARIAYEAMQREGGAKESSGMDERTKLHGAWSCQVKV